MVEITEISREELWEMQIKTLYNSGHHRDLGKVISSILEVDPNFNPAKFYLCRVIADNGDKNRDQVHEVLDDIISSSPTNSQNYVDSLYLKVSLLNSEERYKESLDYLTILNENPLSRNNTDVVLAITDIVEREDILRAYMIIREGRKRFPENLDIRLQEAQIANRVIGEEGPFHFSRKNYLEIKTGPDGKKKYLLKKTH